MQRLLPSYQTCIIRVLYVYNGYYTYICRLKCDHNYYSHRSGTRNIFNTYEVNNVIEIAIKKVFIRRRSCLLLNLSEQETPSTSKIWNISRNIRYRHYNRVQFSDNNDDIVPYLTVAAISRHTFFLLLSITIVTFVNNNHSTSSRYAVPELANRLMLCLILILRIFDAEERVPDESRTQAAGAEGPRTSADKVEESRLRSVLLCPVPVGSACPDSTHLSTSDSNEPSLSPHSRTHSLTLEK